MARRQNEAALTNWRELQYSKFKRTVRFVTSAIPGALGSSRMGQATTHDFIASKPSGRQPLYVWALVQKIPYPPAFLKRTPASPLKALYTGGHWGRSPAIAVSHNGPKNQNTWGVQGGSPWRFFSPFLWVKKGGAGQTRFCRACWSLSAHIKRCPNEKGYPMRGHVLSPRGERTQRDAGGFAPRPPENLPIFSS